ncbi:MAG: NupC/NupG family nucleoside CNT transporter [Burkholderiales bacterium]
MSLVLHSAVGFLALHVIAWGLSENRARVAWRTVLSGMALTIALAVVLLKVPVVADLFRSLNDAVGALDRATTAGSAFVFGYLGGGTLPFDEKFPGSSFVLAFRALPLVLVISALSALLFYWRVLPMIVRGFSFLLQRTMGIGGAEGVAAAANVFVGMVEAPLFVRPYIAGMSRSELFVLMTCGMATIAGTVMVLYASILASTVPDALAHILIASVVSTPAAIVVAVLMVPPAARGIAADIKLEQEARSSMDAITRGTLDGAVLLVNIVAMLIVLVALVHLANQGLGALPAFGGAALTLERMLGWIMAPVVWIMGIPWSEAATAGGLMGAKTVLNELIAFIEMAKLPADALSPRSKLMMTYALCGFANLGSLGIMIGGLASMAPNRRTEIVTLGAKTLVSGTLATLIAGAVVGMLT